MQDHLKAEQEQQLYKDSPEPRVFTTQSKEIFYSHNFKEFARQFNCNNKFDHKQCSHSHIDQIYLSHGKNYKQIKDSSKEVFKRKIQIAPTHNMDSKVIIKRRVLNDYINMVNKRGQIIQKMKDDQNQLEIDKDKNLIYFQKYYNSNSATELTKLFDSLNPKFQGGLKAQLKSQQKLRQKVLEAEKGRNKNISMQLQDQKIKSPSSKEKERIQFERQVIKRAGNMKGYLHDTQDVEQGKSTFAQILEIKKFGSDHAKLRLFESDMKKMIQGQGKNKISQAKLAAHSKQQSLQQSTLIPIAEEDDTYQEARSTAAIEENDARSKQILSDQSSPDLSFIRTRTPYIQPSPVFRNKQDAQFFFPAHKILKPTPEEPSRRYTGLYLEKQLQSFNKKEINKIYIDKYYNNKLLGKTKDTPPPFTAQELESLIEKQKKGKYDNVKSLVSANHHSQPALQEQQYYDKQIRHNYGQDILQKFIDLERDISDYQLKSMKINAITDYQQKQITCGYKIVKHQYLSQLGNKKLKYWNMKDENWVKEYKEEKQQQKVKKDLKIIKFNSVDMSLRSPQVEYASIKNSNSNSYQFQESTNFNTIATQWDRDSSSPYQKIIPHRHTQSLSDWMSDFGKVR